MPDSTASIPTSPDHAPLLVVAFCAAWCNTCGTFGTDYDALARARRDATFVWLDIEDDADVAGDIDVENFPTIAIYIEGRLVHFGVSLPQAALVGRLLAALDEGSPAFDADDAVLTLPRRLAALPAARLGRALRRDVADAADAADAIDHAAAHPASSASTN